MPFKKGDQPNPPKVDHRQIESLASLGCTYDEISVTLGIDKSRLTRTPEYQEAMQRGRSKVKISLRRKQIEEALAGNTTMLVWLGKVMLDQREITRIEQEISVNYDDAAVRLENIIGEVISSAPLSIEDNTDDDTVIEDSVEDSPQISIPGL